MKSSRFLAAALLALAANVCVAQTPPAKLSAMEPTPKRVQDIFLALVMEYFSMHMRDTCDERFPRAADMHAKAQAKWDEKNAPYTSAVRMWVEVRKRIIERNEGKPAADKYQRDLEIAMTKEIHALRQAAFEKGESPSAVCAAWVASVQLESSDLRASPSGETLEEIREFFDAVRNKP